MYQHSQVRLLLVLTPSTPKGEVDCPKPTREALFRDMTPLTGDEVTEFRSIVGGLAWFGVSLRWDITQSVNRLQQFGQAPHRSALSCAMRVCSYVYNTRDFKLGGDIVSKCSNKFEFFSDSDFAGDRKITKKSRSGVLITLNNIPIHWRSATQPKTVYSPAAAEIYALREAVRDGQSVQWVCRDLLISGVSFPFVVQVDSKGADSFAQDSCVRSRHRGVIDMAEEWVQELKSDDVI